MCGRFSLRASREALIEHFQLSQGFYMNARYNIAPGESIPLIKKPGKIEFLKWGFIPYFKMNEATQKGFINIRSETILEKPSFKKAFIKRRCLVPADGFYEWKKMQRVNQPFYIHLKNSSVFAFAGLWEGESFAILTRDSGEGLKQVHARMPVIIPSEYYNDWLNETTTLETINKCLMSISLELLEIYPVSPKMNNVSFDNPTCIYPLHA